MKIPFARETVTILRHDGSAVVAQYCSWRSRDVWVMAGNAATRVTETTVRLPPGISPPRAGDVIVRGHVTDTAQGDIALTRVREKYRDRAMRVKSVARNTRGPLPHWAAKGE